MISTDGEFLDRREAGRRLAKELLKAGRVESVLLALPRGSVPVAFELAKAILAPLDVLLVRKLGTPGHPEFGAGAVVDGADPQFVINEDALRRRTCHRTICKRKRRGSCGRSRDFTFDMSAGGQQSPRKAARPSSSTTALQPETRLASPTGRSGAKGARNSGRPARCPGSGAEGGGRGGSAEYA